MDRRRGEISSRSLVRQPPTKGGAAATAVVEWAVKTKEREMRPPIEKRELPQEARQAVAPTAHQHPRGWLVVSV